MESVHISLSHDMIKLIGLHEILKEVQTRVLNNTAGIKHILYHTISKTFENIPQDILHQDNEACLKFVNMPKISPRTNNIAIS